jgi:putative ABC transport system substrate-binding protein
MMDGMVCLARSFLLRGHFSPTSRILRAPDITQRLAAAAFIALSMLTAENALAQSQPRPARIGWVLVGTEASSRRNVEAMRAGLRELGYVEGRTVVLDLRYADGHLERYPELFSDVVKQGADVIVAGAYQGTLAANQATRTIPIVGVSCGVELLVESLSRPGGNVTGVTCQSPDLGAKQLQLLRETLPGATRIAVLYNPAVPYTRPEVRDLRASIQSSGVQLIEIEVSSPAEFGKAGELARRAGAQAAFVIPDNMLYGNRAELARVLLANRLPFMSGYKDFTDVGGLVSYGSNLQSLLRRSATYIDRILKGALPATMPIEQPTRFELVINQQTAKALGITIPQSLLLRADEVIQ